MSKKPIISLLIFIIFLFMFALLFTDIFSYFLIAMVLAAILKPIIRYISNKLLFPKSLSIFTAVGFLFLINGLLLSTFLPLISEEIKIISTIDIDRMLELVRVPIFSGHTWLLEKEMISIENGSTQDILKKYILEFAGTIDLKSILNTIISLTGSVFVSVLSISFITFLLAYNPGLVKKMILEMVPNAYFEISANAFHKVENFLGRYFRGVLTQMFLNFTIGFLGLTIANVNYTVTIALFAAIMNLIPYFGPILGATFGIIIGLTTSPFEVGSSEFYYLLTKISIVFAIVQVIDNVLLQPIIFSKSLKAHPLEIFVIIFVGANLGGTLGMVLAMPLYIILKVSVTELLQGYKQYKVFNKI